MLLTSLGLKLLMENPSTVFNIREWRASLFFNYNFDCKKFKHKNNLIASENSNT